MLSENSPAGPLVVPGPVARAVSFVPGLPRVDDVTNTVPPWTVPTTPEYRLDPHLDVPSYVSLGLTA